MKFKDIVGYLRERNKLSLRNVRTGQEIWHVFVSRINMILAVVALLLVVFIASLTTVAYTPVLDLIPGYPGSRSRQALIANIMKLDSLSLEVQRWEEYHANFSKILDGQVPQPDTDTARREGIKGSVAARIPLDSVLREQMTIDGSPYQLETGTTTRSENTFEMLPPVKGLIAKAFAPQDGIYGIEIAPGANQVVMAVLDGTVMLNTWNPETGNVVVIQHGGNLVSVYKQVAKVMKTTGEHVRAGESIAVTGAMVDNKVPYITFELWYNGTPVDPENYIVF